MKHVKYDICVYMKVRDFLSWVDPALGFVNVSLVTTEEGLKKIMEGPLIDYENKGRYVTYAVFEVFKTVITDTKDRKTVTQYKLPVMKFRKFSTRKYTGETPQYNIDYIMK